MCVPNDSLHCSRVDGEVRLETGSQLGKRCAFSGAEIALGPIGWLTIVILYHLVSTLEASKIKAWKALVIVFTSKNRWSALIFSRVFNEWGGRGFDRRRVGTGLYRFTAGKYSSIAVAELSQSSRQQPCIHRAAGCPKKRRGRALTAACRQQFATAEAGAVDGGKIALAFAAGDLPSL